MLLPMVFFFLLFFFDGQIDSSVYMNQLLFIFPIENIDGHFSLSCVLAIVNSAALKIAVRMFQIRIFFSSRPRSEMAGKCGFSVSNALRNLQMFSTMPAPAHLSPARSVGGFPVPHGLGSVSSLKIFWRMAILSGVRWHLCVVWTCSAAS